MKKEKKNRFIVGDIGWASSIPPWLLEEIKEERMVYGLASIMKPDFPKVGIAELVAFLMTSALRAPLDSEHAEIYIYLTAKLMKKRGKKLEDFMEKKLTNGLTDQEARYLRELESMIYDKRGGEINHPVLNMLRGMNKNIKVEGERLKKTKQEKLI